MNLSPDQVRAARAAGCAILPASDDQVARLTMQRRIFLIDGVPHLIQRAGSGFFETHGTLAPLLGAAPGEAAALPGETLQEAEAADATTTLAMAAESRGGGGRGAQVIRRGRPRGPRGA